MWIAEAVSSSSAAAYAPLLVAGGGLVTALVTAFARRDKKATDFQSTLDARANTAIKGLTEAYDRVEQERARVEKERDEWQDRAEAAEAELARRGNSTRKPRSPRAG